MFLRLIIESFRFAWQALVNNKLRTMLSLLGVTIGIFSIIFVLSVVDSMESEMRSSFDMIGSDVLFIQKWPMGPEEGDTEFAWWNYMSRRPVNMKDMEKLQARLTTAEAIAYSNSANAQAEFGSNYMKNAVVLAVTYQYNNVINLKLAEGRYFTNLESEGGGNRAIIGATVKEQLFGNQEAVGKSIKVGGLKVDVIGVFEKEGTSIFGSGMDQAVMMPYGYATRLVASESDGASILVKGGAGVTNKELKDDVISVFREIRSIKPDKKNDFSIIQSSMIADMVDSIVGVFNTVGIIIGIFAILVGAFSIANIMFVSVSERTNIIGIQKALGAKNHFILGQFLFESVALCLIGGLFGLLFVGLIVMALDSFVDQFHFILPFERILMGLGISVVVGLVAGIIPALKAARMNPVDAMRAK
jgi:putative ABC transport system permease protein